MQALQKILQVCHPQIQREYNAPGGKGLTMGGRVCYPLSNTISGGSLRRGERNMKQQATMMMSMLMPMRMCRMSNLRCAFK